MEHTTRHNLLPWERCAVSTRKLIRAIDEVFIDHFSLGGPSVVRIPACVLHFPNFDPVEVAGYIKSCGFHGGVRAPRTPTPYPTPVLNDGRHSCATSDYCGDVVFGTPQDAATAPHALEECDL